MLQAHIYELDTHTCKYKPGSDSESHSESECMMNVLGCAFSTSLRSQRLSSSLSHGPGELEVPLRLRLAVPR